MTRTDYKLVAEAILAWKKERTPHGRDVDSLVNSCIKVFERADPNFNVAKFIAAVKG